VHRGDRIRRARREKIPERAQRRLTLGAHLVAIGNEDRVALRGPRIRRPARRNFFTVVREQRGEGVRNFVGPRFAIEKREMIPYDGVHAFTVTNFSNLPNP